MTHPVALGLWSALALVDAIVLSRRAAGALSTPLSAPWAWNSFAIAAGIAVAALVLWRRQMARGNRLRDRWPEAATVVLPFVWSLCFAPGLTPFAWGGLLAGWGLLVTATGLTGVWLKEGCEPASERRSPMDVDESIPLVAPQPSTLNPQPASDVTHWQKRIRIDDGEMIEGAAHVHFLAGQKESLLHLSFCPPFAGVPEVHAEDSLGGALDIRAEAVHPFGARLSVRRTAAFDSAESREIAFSAIPQNSANGE